MSRSVSSCRVLPSLGALLLPLTVLWLAACSGVPPMPPRDASVVLTATDDTRIGQAVHAANPGDGRSGLRMLSDPLEAFAARMLLLATAERSLDVQYYIWRPDTTGTLLLDALRQAADRGVRVRLLLDDNGIAGMDPLLAALDAHPMAQVRLFNPYPNRWFKPWGYLTDFQRLNRRMHNKALLADVQAAIVGGRNIGDAYFGADPALAFADLDVLSAGPVAEKVGQSFDAYWNSALAYPLAALVSPGASDQAALQAQVQRVRALPEATQYVQALQQTELAQQLAAGPLVMEWVPVRFLADPPGKIEGEAAEASWMAHELTQSLGQARDTVDLISPYFVPGEGGTADLARQSASGVHVRVVTNSLAATDVAAVHAGYERRRVDLLRAGVHLYELRPDASAPQPSAWRLGSSGAASLHGKTFSVDRRRAFVGSMNLDPRSIRLNTELGMVIDSPALAEAIAQTLDQWLPLHAYELRLIDGDRVVWVERTASGERIHDSEPGASVWRRMLVEVLSWLPIEGLL